MPGFGLTASGGASASISRAIGASASRAGADRRLRALVVRRPRPQCTLLVFIDDATSRLMHLQLVESESTFAYFHATRAYLEAWGKPVAFYSDKHGVFRVNHPGALAAEPAPAKAGGMTQFG